MAPDEDISPLCAQINRLASKDPAEPGVCFLFASEEKSSRLT